MYFLFYIFLYCDISSIFHTGSNGIPPVQGNYASPEITNDPMKEQNNIAKRTEDTHVYYKSWNEIDIATGQHYWVDVDSKPDFITHQNLSQSYRRAVTVSLPFKFPFYGHEIDKVMIATGGFLYTGDYVHSRLAATQYIAPLMANFDLSLSNDSYIKYYANSTTFTVLWENVALRERPNAGNFTFEASLCRNGDIIFVYKNIPNITISEEYHPVKVGLSDGYVLDKDNISYHFVRWRKIIIKYHQMHFDQKDLKNWTTIYLTPLETCNTRTTCESCIAKHVNFECRWCDGRCSSGIDRNRHDWLKKDCDKRKLNETKDCAASNNKLPTTGAHEIAADQTSQEKSSNKSSVFLFLMGSVGVVWFLYAYRNPHSTSGQILFISLSTNSMKYLEEGRVKHDTLFTIAQSKFGNISK